MTVLACTGSFLRDQRPNHDRGFLVSHGAAEVPRYTGGAAVRGLPVSGGMSQSLVERERRGRELHDCGLVAALSGMPCTLEQTTAPSADLIERTIAIFRNEGLNAV